MEIPQKSKIRLEIRAKTSKGVILSAIPCFRGQKTIKKWSFLEICFLGQKRYTPKSSSTKPFFGHSMTESSKMGFYGYLFDLRDGEKHAFLPNLEHIGVCIYMCSKGSK